MEPFTMTYAEMRKISKKFALDSTKSFSIIKKKWDSYEPSPTVKALKESGSSNPIALAAALRPDYELSEMDKAYLSGITIQREIPSFTVFKLPAENGSLNPAFYLFSKKEGELLSLESKTRGGGHFERALSPNSIKNSMPISDDEIDGAIARVYLTLDFQKMLKSKIAEEYDLRIETGADPDVFTIQFFIDELLSN